MQELLPLLLGLLLAITIGLQQRPGILRLRVVAVIAVGALVSLVNQEQHAWRIALFVDTALVAAGATFATLAMRYLRRSPAGAERRITTGISS